MLRKVMKYSMLPVLALSLLVAGCENTGGPTGPQASAPTQDLLAADGPNGFTVVKEKDASTGVVTGVVGSAGGKLILGKHELRIPKDAVSGATTFSMTKVDGELRFTLTATQTTTNDIGSTGFAVPVQLVVSYADATNVSDPSLLKVLWAKPDGTFEEQSTTVDLVGNKAIGSLKHFSQYVLGTP